MCFQGFVYFLCGHDRIIEQTCEEAREMQDPFFLKVSCPNYRRESLRPDQYCGTGKYYCRQTDEGPALDAIQQRYNESASKVKYYEAQLKHAQTLATQFKQAARVQGIDDYASKQLPAYRKIAFMGEQAVKLSQQAQQDTQQLKTFILSAVEQLKLRQQHVATASESAPPALVLPPEALPRIPSELAMQMAGQSFASHLQRAPGQSYVSAQAINVSDYGPPQAQKQQQVRRDQSPVESEGSNINVVPRRPLNAQLSTLAQEILERQRADAYRDTGIVPATHASKPRGHAKRQIEQDTLRDTPTPPSKKKASRKPRTILSEEPNDVRRSTRVRDKKVSYAESTGSSPGSREASPDKSDASVFSPEKSDRSVSPVKPLRRSRQQSLDVKPEMQRTSSTLSSKIADSKRRAVAPTYSTSDISPLEARVQPSNRARQDLIGEAPHLTGNIRPRPTLQNATTHMVAQSRGHSLPRATEYDRPSLGPKHQRQPLSRPRTSPNVGTGTSGGMAFAGAPAGLYQSRSDNGGLVPMLPPAAHGQMQHGIPCGTPTSQTGFAPMRAPMSYNYAAPMSRPFGTAFDFGSYGHIFTGRWPNSVQAPTSNNNVHGAPMPLGAQRDVGLGTFTGDTAAPSTPMSRAAIPAVDSRSDLANTLRQGTFTPNNAFPLPNYAKMRRSFSATADLTPPVTDQTPDTEPAKRTMPASSPILSRKQPRLSLPADDEHTGFHVQATDSPLVLDAESTSSPSKTPAPVLAPTAVMYVPAVGQPAEREGDAGDYVQATEEEEAGSGGAPSAQLPSEVFDEGAGDTGTFGSDIDWSLVNEDFVE